MPDRDARQVAGAAGPGALAGRRIVVITGQIIAVNGGLEAVR